MWSGDRLGKQCIVYQPNGTVVTLSHHHPIQLPPTPNVEGAQAQRIVLTPGDGTLGLGSESTGADAILACVWHRTTGNLVRPANTVATTK